MISISGISDRVCVITGGCGILGSVFASGLLEAGAKVSILDYKKGRCEDCAQRRIADKTGASIFCVVANVLEKDSLLHAKEEINEHLGPVDILINAAGGNSPLATTQDELLDENNINDLSKSFFGLDVKGFRDVFDLNLLGTVIPTMVFAQDMINRNGSVINISSMSAFRPLTRVPAYSAAKASVDNITQWLAVHFAKSGIRVNAIAPGFFLTKQNEFLLLDKETNTLTERGKKIINNTPMSKFGVPADLLGTLYYLVSDMSSFVTGVVIPVDGGFNAFAGV